MMQILSKRSNKSYFVFWLKIAIIILERQNLRRERVSTLFMGKLSKENYQTNCLIYQDETGFDCVSKIGTCSYPRGYRSHVAGQHIREFRYYYGIVDIQTLNISENIEFTSIPP